MHHTSHIYLFLNLRGPTARGDAYADETKGHDENGHVHTHHQSSSILPRWFTSNREEVEVSHNDPEIDILRMIDNPILLSPERLKGKHKIVRWNNESKLNRLPSLQRMPVHDIENSSNSGSDMNSDYYYDSDDHDCYGGKSVYDVGSENSDQLSYSQNYGIASVKIANKKAHDEAKLRNAAKNNLYTDLEDQKHPLHLSNNSNNNTNNSNNNSMISNHNNLGGVSTTVSPSNVHHRITSDIFKSPEKNKNNMNNNNIEITSQSQPSELPQSMIFEMNKKMNNQINFLRNNNVNQRIIINNNNGRNNENGKSNIIEMIPDNGVSLFHSEINLNPTTNTSANNISNMNINMTNNRNNNTIINNNNNNNNNNDQKMKLTNIQTSSLSQNFNDQNDPENAWLSVPLDDEKSPPKFK